MEVASRFEALLSGDEDLRDARMTAMCDRLAALVCTVLLLGEADQQALAGLDYRKLLVANEFRKRYLDPNERKKAERLKESADALV